MIIALNNKCNLTKSEFNNYIQELKDIKSKHNIILIPSFININEMKEENIILGAQNVSAYQEGAYTGEISAKQLKSYDVKYALVGHSERRMYQKESNDEINKKIHNLFNYDITPILCIGETKEEKEKNKTELVLQQEISSAIKELTEEQKNKLIIAYEPVWSIGTGSLPTPNEIEKVLQLIKKTLPDSKLLYGGSVNEKNVEILKKVHIIDGFLLGGLSLQTEKLKVFLNNI